MRFHIRCPRTSARETNNRLSWDQRLDGGDLQAGLSFVAVLVCIWRELSRLTFRNAISYILGCLVVTQYAFLRLGSRAPRVYLRAGQPVLTATLACDELAEVESVPAPGA